MTLRFTVGLAGLNTSIDTIYDTTQAFFEDGDVPPNLSWEHVTVVDEAAREEWIAAKNSWLRAAWTPNQTSEDRAENAIAMREAEATMKRLEDEAAEVKAQ